VIDILPSAFALYLLSFLPTLPLHHHSSPSLTLYTPSASQTTLYNNINYII